MNNRRLLAARQQTYRHGLSAEWLCRLALRLKGYRILAQRYRTPIGEIDIVAKRGAVVAIIEVKARPSLNEAAAAISPRQQARLVRAATHFLSAKPALQSAVVRFDAMLVAPKTWPRHIVNAWNAEP